MNPGRGPLRSFKKGALLLLLSLALLPGPSRAAFPLSEGGGTKAVLRVRLLDRRGEVPREGVLLVGRSPLASFPALIREIPLPPLRIRKIPFRFGRARISLPRGLPVALSWQGKPWLGWRGPFFGGQTILLQEPSPSSLAVKVVPHGKAQTKARFRFHLFPRPPRGTGACRPLEAEGWAQENLVLENLPPGPAGYVLLVEKKAPLKGELILPPGKRLEISLAPPRGLILEGRIVTDSKAPTSLEGGQIFLDGWECPWSRTDGLGRFRLEGVPADGRTHKIEIFFSAHRAPALLWWPPPGAGPPGSVEIPLPPSFLLRGKVLLPGGGPAAGLTLTVMGRRLTSLGWTSWVIQTTTSSSGEWDLPVPPGKEGAVLLVQSEKGGPWGMLLTPPLQGKKSLELGEVRLPLGTRLSGRIRTPEGKGVSPARVELLPSPGNPVPGDLLARETPTAPDGSFLFLGVGKGIYILRARAPGRAGVRKTLRVGAFPETLDLTLPEGLQVRGLVLLPGGKGAPKARVSFEPLAEGWTPVVVLTDSKGRFLAPGVPPVPARVSVSWRKNGLSWSAGILFPGKKEGPLVLRLFREP